MLFENQILNLIITIAVPVEFKKLHSKGFDFMLNNPFSRKNKFKSWSSYSIVRKYSTEATTLHNISEVFKDHIQRRFSAICLHLVQMLTSRVCSQKNIKNIDGMVNKLLAGGR